MTEKLWRAARQLQKSEAEEKDKGLIHKALSKEFTTYPSQRSVITDKETGVIIHFSDNQTACWADEEKPTIGLTWDELILNRHRTQPSNKANLADTVFHEIHHWHETIREKPNRLPYPFNLGEIEAVTMGHAAKLFYTGMTHRNAPEGQSATGCILDYHNLAAYANVWEEKAGKKQALLAGRAAQTLTQFYLSQILKAAGKKRGKGIKDIIEDAAKKPNATKLEKANWLWSKDEPSLHATEEAAEEDPDGILGLAWHHLHGVETPKNLRRFYETLKQAADCGSWHAQLCLWGGAQGAYEQFLSKDTRRNTPPPPLEGTIATGNPRKTARGWRRIADIKNRIGNFKDGTDAVKQAAELGDQIAHLLLQEQKALIDIHSSKHNALAEWAKSKNWRNSW